MTNGSSSLADLSALFSLEGKVALVTGGSRGLGLAIAHGLSAYGARVHLVARDRAMLDEAARKLSGIGEVSVTSADLSKLEEIDGLVDELTRTEARVDILVNNAGAVWNESLDAFPAHGWDKVMSVNVRAPFFLTQKLLPLLRKSAHQHPPARIINVASTDALHVPLTDTYSYTAAKAGLVMVTKMLAKRLGPERITANVIAPGAFPTRMTQRTLSQLSPDYLAQIPLGRLGESMDISGAAIFLASRAGAYVNGAVLPVDGGWFGAL